MSEFAPPAAVIPVTIDNGGTASAAFDLQHYTIIGIEFPSAFTGATIGFTTASTPDGTYKTVVDASGAAVSVTVSTSSVVGYVPDLAGLRWTKITCSAQGAARSLNLICKA